MASLANDDLSILTMLVVIINQFNVVLLSTGLVISIGLSVLQYIDINSSRNMMILGVSFMFGMILPFYLRDNPGIIKTGQFFSL